jgi:hypothetical protein
MISSNSDESKKYTLLVFNIDSNFDKAIGIYCFKLTFSI